MTEHEIFVRKMSPDDFPSIAALSEQLGYPVSKVDLADRFEAIADSSENRLIVAQAQRGVVGWCHVYSVRLLESEGYAELGGLVVDKNCRRRGIGLALVRDAESWALSNGFSRVRAYSGDHRADAHDFYRSAGYDRHTPTMFQRGLLNLVAQSKPRREQDAGDQAPADVD